MLTLFKIAARVKQYKDRVLLHLPSGCPVKGLLAQVCQRLSTRTSGCAPCRLLHGSPRLAHETAPPTLAFNYFMLQPNSRGRGAFA